jgi:signal transduction histidine kinase/CheY-like chemotaxis protein
MPGAPDKRLIKCRDLNKSGKRVMMPPAKKQKPRLLICSKAGSKTGPKPAALKAAFDVSDFHVSLNTVDTLGEAEERWTGRDDFECLLLDSDLAAEDWDAALSAIRDLSSRAAIVLLSTREQTADSIKAIEQGAEDYLFRDELQTPSLQRSVSAALARHRRTPRSEEMPQVGDCEDLLKRILKTHNDAMLILGQNHDIRFINPAAVSLLETDETSVIGEVFPFAVEDGDATELEIPVSGCKFQTVNLTAFGLNWEGQASLLIILREVATDSSDTQRYLLLQEQLNLLLDSISDGVILTDGEGWVEGLSQGAAALLGKDPRTYLGQPFDRILKPSRLREANTTTDGLRSNWLPSSAAPTQRVSAVLEGARGDKLPITAVIHGLFDSAGQRQACLFIVEQSDRQAEPEASESFDPDSLNTVGLLVGGIAHDFNNMLTAIMGNIALARLALEKGDTISQKLDAAEGAARQAESLSQQLLTFSKAGALALKRTDIREVIEECAQFFLRGSNVTFTVNAEAGLWPVDVDKGRISRLISNLLINADQAMPDGGMIDIYLRNLVIRRAEVPDLAPGEYICFEIKDSGTGISPENLKRIFAPYFTTKENGNGLGLASSHAIARNHKGTITADSSFGYGSIFRVYLPKSRIHPTDNEPSKKQDKMKHTEPTHRGCGRILLMDDMEAMLMVASEILRMLGYEVECCADGEEAIRIYKAAKESGNPFAAVVFDLTVPGGMGGEEAANRLREYDPDLIAIASSGYSNSDVMSDHKRSSFKAVVPKPYRIDEMSSALESLLKRD